jgi:PAS domain S-box-containing protein
VAILAGLIITPVILFPAGMVFSMDLDQTTIINNAYYLVVLSLFLMVILEGLIYFQEGTESQIKAKNLEQELHSEMEIKAMVESMAQIEQEKNRMAEQQIVQHKFQNKELAHEIEISAKLALQLDESRAQLHSLLSNLGGAAYRCHFDREFTMQYISEKIFEISGFHASDFIDNTTRSFLSVIHPDDRDLCHSNISEALKLKSPYEFEYRIIHNNGEVVWVSENGKCIFDDQGKVAFLDGIITDVTRRKKAESLAREGERKYKELMDLLPQPIFELNLEGEIVLSNKAGDEFFGPLPDNPDEKISALNCFVKEDIPRIIENFKKSAQGIATEPAEFTAIKSDGTHCPVMVFGNPIMRHDKIVGRRGIIIDISERKKYEVELLKAKEELEQINNSLEQMVARRTHELTEVNTQLLQVQKENLQSQFEVLKSQIDPHFMFNSLNVLSGLIQVDITKAQLFIDEFSQIYRYVLETIEQPVVTLNKELEFMRSYLFLQQIRYGNSLTYSVNIPAKLLPCVVPPLSLQVLLENAMKHNIVNENKPLNIQIYSQGDSLFIKNPIQPKVSGRSTGLGLKNLIKRYALISSLEPSFEVVDNYYVAKIPLIKIDSDERTHN